MMYIAAFASAFALFLARFNFFRFPKKGIAVLLYHRINNMPTKTSLDKFSISPKAFERQLIYLKKMGFISILPDEIDEIKNKKLWKNNRYVLITFDDGYKDNLEAAKILKKHSMKGLFFISTAYLGKTMNFIEMLNENDIKKLLSYGMGIGSHSHNHEKLVQLNRKEIEKEISQSIQILSQYSDIEDFAYPFGSYSEKVIDVLRRQGIKRAYIIGQKIYQIDKMSSYKIPRAIIRKNSNLIDFYLMITRGRSRF